MTSRHREVFLGIDVGTQGVRSLAIDTVGQVVATSRIAFPRSTATTEQSPQAWWHAVLSTLREIGAALAADRALVPVALSVTSTSGTVIPLDAQHRPLHPALMYSDRRAGEEVAEIATIAPDLMSDRSWGLPKILWFTRRGGASEVVDRVRAWRHAGDYLLGQLTGRWEVTDVTSALKSGYDVAAERWPEATITALGLDPAWLPIVVPSGTAVGRLLPSVAIDTGLPPNLMVTTGMTDGCASQVASGAVQIGDWCSTIGTTLVIKGVTSRRLVDRSAGIYSHRHPDGGWMPGGASNAGADWIARDYSHAAFDELERAAATVIPTGQVAYPLRLAGERFPFHCDDARGFDPPGISEPTLYAARLEGIAYLERLAFRRLEVLAGEPVERLYLAGGGSRSRLWSRIRANVLHRPVLVAELGEAALGAAVIAAASRFGSLRAAAGALTRTTATIEPDGLETTYDHGYARFIAALVARGYLAEEELRGIRSSSVPAAPR